MIEALIRITDHPSKVKAKGDIVCVKLSGSPWGSQEVRRLMVVEINDPTLEAKLNEMKLAGEPHPVITNPYAEFERNQNTGVEEMTVRSSKKLNIAKLDAQTKADIEDLTKTKPIVKGVEIIEKTKEEKPASKAK